LSLLRTFACLCAGALDSFAHPPVKVTLGPEASAVFRRTAARCNAIGLPLMADQIANAVAGLLDPQSDKLLRNAAAMIPGAVVTPGIDPRP
jgi:hypothetical protein